MVNWVGILDGFEKHEAREERKDNKHLEIYSNDNDNNLEENKRDYLKRSINNNIKIYLEGQLLLINTHYY